MGGAKVNQRGRGASISRARRRRVTFTLVLSGSESRDPPRVAIAMISMDRLIEWLLRLARRHVVSVVTCNVMCA